MFEEHVYIHIQDYGQIYPEDDPRELTRRKKVEGQPFYWNSARISLQENRIFAIFLNKTRGDFTLCIFDSQRKS